MTLAVAAGWWVGWGLGAVVVLLVAALILAIAKLARDIARQADDITEALDGARVHTEPLFAVKHTNHALDRVTRGVHRLLSGGGA